jgi:CRISPR-associated protein Cas5h
MTTVPTRGKLRVGLPDPTKPRQQHNYEMLVEPAYRVDLWLSDGERFADLRAALEAGRSHYTPSLGLSECLAELEFRGTHEIAAAETEGDATVHSAVPDAVDDVIVERETRCQLERSPAFMTTDAGGRTTTAFTSYAYNPDAEPLTVRDVPTYRVDGRAVMFV